MSDSQPSIHNQTNQQSPLKSTNVALGQGYLTVKGESRNTAIVPTVSSDGTIATASIMLASSLQELAESLSTKQSAGIGFLDFFGIESKNEFAKSLRITTYSLCIVVCARKSSRSFCTHTAFTEEASGFIPDPESPKTAAKFVDQYGDVFVDSIAKGGEYIGVLHFECSSSEEQESLRSGLGASVIAKGLSLEAETQELINNEIQKTNISFSFREYISGIKNPETPKDPKELIHFANRFAGLTLDDPTTIAIELQGYEHVPSEGDNEPFKVIERNRNRIFRRDATRPGWFQMMLLLQDAQNQITRIQEVHDYYRPLANLVDEKLKEMKQINHDSIEEIGQVLTNFTDDPAGDLPEFERLSPSERVPVLEFTQNDVGLGPWSSKMLEQENFRDVKNVAASIMKRVSMRSIQLRSGEWIDGLTTHYQYPQGAKTVVRSEVHGGNGGAVRPELVFNFENGCAFYTDNVTEISGSASIDRLASLKIANRHQATQGGESRSDASGFQVAFPDGKGVIPLGFFGRATEEEVNQLGIICITLQRVSWRPLPLGSNSKNPSA